MCPRAAGPSLNQNLFRPFFIFLSVSRCESLIPSPVLVVYTPFFYPYSPLCHVAAADYPKIVLSLDQERTAAPGSRLYHVQIQILQKKPTRFQ
jgi:hypothetical protein